MYKYFSKYMSSNLTMRENKKYIYKREYNGYIMVHKVMMVRNLKKKTYFLNVVLSKTNC